nr:hypothetical protein GCM10017745_41360 [Saccharothrix mutabilis subsp. capreolus]
MTGRTRMTAEERRESILAAATKVFAQTGYLRGKTSAVAREVGVSEPVVFQNFGTKATLFAAVVERAADHVCRVVERMTDSAVPVTSLLELILDPDHLERVHSAGSVGAIIADASSITDVPEVEAAARTSTRRFATALTACWSAAGPPGSCAPTWTRKPPPGGCCPWWLPSASAGRPPRTPRPWRRAWPRAPWRS